MRASKQTGERASGPLPGEGGRIGGGGFTLIELLTVIAIIAILAAIGAGLAGVAMRKSKESATRAELAKLTTAIESYRNDFNQYPPDNVVRTQSGSYVNAAINPLYYELRGTVSLNQGRAYRLPDHDEELSASVIKRVFHRGGFLNSVEAPDTPKSYLSEVKARQLAEVELAGVGHVDLLAAPVEWPVNQAALRDRAPLRGLVSDARQLRINPWHYVATNPTNNLNSFDLWADIWLGREFKTIGNWNN
ncbi:MAG: prepilin-type N-terminal cleavage/methylation domain-containing protein [Verrucomicrobia bacterium]|nr:MAG: prepilin-type N-terminal cleavage/methylation domain-containing protein [Verrucomicrobiota bacterium]